MPLLYGIAYISKASRVLKRQNGWRHSANKPRKGICDQDGEDIKGVFYEQELLKTVAETTHIAEVLKTRRRNGVKDHFVKWIGYSDKHNRWIRDEDIVQN
ncbi:hypothetical protein niasHT_002860 [Heterodera trifolii]|uniref:Chromo domain-containing protein n=1 Tax=Heterodera trifolii TaxID=157864 RepID=A0ABD2LQN1_9BILA